MDMKKWLEYGISLFVLFLVSLTVVSAQSIEVDYPSEVVQGEIFDFDIELIDFSPEVYDVKIDITGGGDRISRIWDGNEWKSTHYYMNEAVNTKESNESSFSLNITEIFEGAAEIEVKIRSGSRVESFSGYQLDVVAEEDGGGDGNNEVNETELYIEIEYDDKINNGETFEVKVKAFNLEDKEYDVKIVVIDEDNNIISETFHEKEDEWKSSNYYVENVFETEGNESENIKLRIKEAHVDYKGDAKIQAKIRENGGGEIIDELEDDIEVKEKKEEAGEIEPVLVQESQQNIEEKVETRTVIQLNQPQNINSLETSLYKSKTQYIREYAIYGFAFFCVFVIIILVLKHKHLEKNKI